MHGVSIIKQAALDTLGNRPSKQVGQQRQGQLIELIEPLVNGLGQEPSLPLQYIVQLQWATSLRPGFTGLRPNHVLLEQSLPY